MSYTWSAANCCWYGDCVPVVDVLDAGTALGAVPLFSSDWPTEERVDVEPEVGEIPLMGNTVASPGGTCLGSKRREQNV